MQVRHDSKGRILNKGEYQKADGRYMYKYTDSKGKDRFVYSWTLTQSDRPPKGRQSDKCLRILEREIAKDLLDGIDTYQSKKTTLNSFYDDYISQKNEIRTSTRTNYKYMYDKYVRNSIGVLKLVSIKFSDVKKFFNHLIDDIGFKPNSVETIQTILHPIFETAVRDEYIRVNPTNGIMKEMKKSHNWEKPKRHALTKAQQSAFTSFVAESKTYSHWLPYFTVLLGTGLRIGEFTGLTRDDINFKNNIIKVTHNLVYRPDEHTGKAGYYINAPKTDSGVREIPMFTEVKSALLQVVANQMSKGGCTRVIDGYSGFIFTNRYNDVLLPTALNRAIKRIVEEYNKAETAKAEKEHREPLLLPNFSVHNLRHTFCVRLCEQNVNIKVIQEIMGHSDIQTTMDIYNEATQEFKKESFENIEGKMQIC